jgi:hypothetical protein
MAPLKLTEKWRTMMRFKWKKVLKVKQAIQQLQPLSPQSETPPPPLVHSIWSNAFDDPNAFSKSKANNAIAKIGSSQ